MPWFTKFNDELCKGAHNISTAVMQTILTNTAPTVTTNTVKTDITQISAGNGYSTDGFVHTPTYNWNSSTGTVTLSIDDAVFTASGGTMETWQYSVLFNNSHASDGLVSMHNHGSTQSLASGQSRTIDYPSPYITVTQT